MAAHSSQSTLEAIYNVIDMEPGVNLATQEYMPETKYQSILFETAREKLGAEAVFFYQPPSSGTSIPYIFFYRLESRNKIEQTEQLANLHKLAWNLGRAPLLMAALPDGHVRIYDTYKPPTDPQPGRDYQTGLIDALNIFSDAEKVRRDYHRYEFESGRYWQRNRKRFNPKNRADQTLLQNLKIMRRSLMAMLPDLSSQDASEIIHSLLGRSIFIKYLEDRRDRKNNNVFPSGFFNKFVEGATGFTDVLPNWVATYRLFRYLNEKFNGDLFPVTPLEEQHITDDHLQELKLFLTGQARLSDRQLRFWKFYSFDIIPIEFISSIYEEFFHIAEKEKAKGKSTKTGTHYTPHHLVELLVDEVLPWEGTETDCRTLDPACGSGIFLVEIYRRLIARWEQANPNRRIAFEPLADLLTRNIFGVDLDQNAVRVAAFSLYLTLCDFLEPRQIWDEVTFPPLRQRNLFASDFFEEEQDFADQTYDLIIGNPPWQSDLTESARRYCLEWQQQRDEAELPIRQFAPDNQIALTFLWRAAEFCEVTGEICLLMPSKGLLFNRSPTHTKFRRDFLATYHVKTVINLSAYRRILFDKAVGAGTAIIYTPQEADEAIPILYCSPKPTHSVEDKWQFTIDPQDIAELPRSEASRDDTIWKMAMWGGPRDYELLQKLSTAPYQTLLAICEGADPEWVHAEGAVVGNKKNNASWLMGKPFVDTRDLRRFVVNEDSLPHFTESRVQRWAKTKKTVFEGPHILMKQSPLVGEPGLRAALLKHDAVFKHSILGISGSPDDINLLAQCCLLLNSHIPLYFAMMTSRRWLVERDELEKEEIMGFPMPPDLFANPISYSDLQQLADDDDWEKKVQSKAEELYNLTEDELILIDDAINYTLDYFRLKEKSHATAPTFNERDGEKHLTQYIQIARNTLQNTFGYAFRPIIFQGAALPLRVVGLIRGAQPDDYSDDIIFEQSKQILDEALEEINLYLAEQRSPGVFIRRNVRAYIGKVIYIVKPDQKRYWTRSSALRDADDIFADIVSSRD